MAGSLNMVQLIGHLGKDPEIRSTQAGKKIATFRVATSETWKDKQTGERKESVEWSTVVIFNDGLAEVAEKYLKKGSKVYIQGALKTRKWQDQQGTDRYSTEVVLQAFNGQLTLLDKAERHAPDESDYGTTSTRAKAAQSQAGSTKSTTNDDMDDSIPF